MQHTFDAGQKVGQWTLLEYRPGRTEGGRRVHVQAWKCLCTCSTLRWVDAGNLRSGQSTSCGHEGRPAWKSRNLQPINSVFALGGQS